MQHGGRLSTFLNGRVLAGAALLFILAVPTTAFAEDIVEENGISATFNERYPAEIVPETTQAMPETMPVVTQVRATRRVVRARPTTRVLVVRRSFLDAGTDVQPGQERKYLDYAFPPTHVPTDVVTNTGGRPGWDTRPLPNRTFPFFY